MISKMYKRYLFVILLPVVVMLQTHCTLPDKFQGVSWNALFNIPLINRFYNIFDLEEDDHFVVVGDEIYLIYFDELESDAAASEIKMDPKTTELTPISAFDSGTIVPLYIDETGMDLEDIDLISGVLAEGIIRIELVHPRPELEELEIMFYDFSDPDGEPLQVTITDFNTPIYSYDVAGYTVGQIDNEEVLDYLEFFVQTTSQGFFYDLVYLRIFFDEPIYFDFFRGFLENKKIRLNDRILDNDIDFPYNISNALQFEEGSLDLTFTNELGFDAQFVGTLLGINEKDDKSFFLEINESDEVIFRRATAPGMPVTTTVTLIKPEVTAFINIFPEILRIENSKLLLGNIDQTSGFAFASDRNRGSFTLQAPSVFTVSNETVVPDSVYSIEITPRNREYLEKYPEMISLDVTLENTIPVGLSIDIYFSEAADTLFIFNPETYNDVHTIKFAGNYVSAALEEGIPMKNEVHFLLEHPEIALFLNETVYFAVKITFDESDDYVTVLPHHYLQIISKIAVDMNLDLDN